MSLYNLTWCHRLGVDLNMAMLESAVIAFAGMHE